MTSVNTNIGALVALQNLQQIQFNLNRTQNQVSTGLRVSSPIDDAADFAIAQGLRSNISAYTTVQQSLASGTGVLSVAIAGATSVSNLLASINSTAIQASNPSNTASQQSILSANFNAQLSQLNTFISNSVYNGRNLLSAGAAAISITSTISGGQLSISAASSLSQISSVLSGGVGTTAAALSLLSAITAQQLVVGTQLGSLGAAQTSINFLTTFTQTLSNAVTQGLGSLVDANLAQASAQLQAEQVQQQLAVQALSIANARPQVLLSLFR
ncbi:MAG TPA: flagellin [Alphaproteobacteria bacterium]|nr:flagellin [Alphaproteobacteria bacterium]